MLLGRCADGGVCEPLRWLAVHPASPDETYPPAYRDVHQDQDTQVCPSPTICPECLDGAGLDLVGFTLPERERLCRCISVVGARCALLCGELEKIVVDGGLTFVGTGLRCCAWCHEVRIRCARRFGDASRRQQLDLKCAYPCHSSGRPLVVGDRQGWAAAPSTLGRRAPSPFCLKLPSAHVSDRDSAR